MRLGPRDPNHRSHLLSVKIKLWLLTIIIDLKVQTCDKVILMIYLKEKKLVGYTQSIMVLWNLKIRHNELHGEK